ncbi:MAG: hypothetical protein KJ697_03820 [Nanoarchaeota archaeon]|nr:hypothetical protein [Nanoarchaeota archaeon]MBU4124292.1 hypothetical protein [Nanoarchaeota archaeon]
MGDKCIYNRINFAGDSICLLDPKHINMNDVEFRKYTMHNIKETPEKKHYWAKYWKAVEICKNECRYLDKEGLVDQTKLVAWIPDELDDNIIKIDMELIPDSSIGSKCKCFINKVANPQINPYMKLKEIIV